MSRPRVLSLQTPLLGNRTYGELLRRMFDGSDAIDFRALWADAERNAYERTPLGRVIYRLAFTQAPLGWLRDRNADLYALRYELGSSYWARRLLRRELARSSPDALHFHTQGLALLSRGTMERYPTVISGDMTSRRTAEQFTHASWRRTHGLQHAIEGAALRRAAALVPFSQYAARSMIDDYRVDPANVHVIAPGVDLGLFGTIGAEREARHDPIRRILFIGGEFERKGGPDLVEAFLRTFADDENVELHIVTHAPDSVAAHPRIFVHLDVAAYSPRWRELYERACVVALPSRREAYGHVYLEAGAARLPVVGSRVGAGPELVVDGVTGFLISPGDVAALGSQLKRLTSDRELAAALGVAARERVENEFDAQRNARRLEQLFVTVSRAEVARAKKPALD
jgi:glycosyltransferase involved in cell wall biosynthesis